MKEFFVSLFMFLVAEPMQAEWREALAGAGLAPEVASQTAACVASAGPAIAERAWEDPWWGFTSAVSVTIGMTSPEAVLEGVNPECAKLIGNSLRLMGGNDA